MVGPVDYVLLAAEVAQESQTVLERLDPQRRVAVLMALVGLVLIGMFLVIAIPLGGRYVRRAGNSRRADRACDSGQKKRGRAARQRVRPSRRAVTTDTLDATGSDETQVTDEE